MVKRHGVVRSLAASDHCFSTRFQAFRLDSGEEINVNVDIEPIRVRQKLNRCMIIVCLLLAGCGVCRRVMERAPVRQLEYWATKRCWNTNNGVPNEQSSSSKPYGTRVGRTFSDSFQGDRVYP